MTLDKRTQAAISKAKWLPAFMLSALLLAGCGFHSVYGTHENQPTVAAGLNQVAIDIIPDRNGQILRNDLMDRMYNKDHSLGTKYHLKVSLRSTEEGIGLLPNAITTLNELNLYAEYTLTDESGKAVLNSTAHAVANFNQLQEQYATLAARDNAYQRCLDEASAQIVERLSMFFSEGPLKTQVPDKDKPPEPVNPFKMTP